MDIHDVSEDPRFLPFLDKHLAGLQDMRRSYLHPNPSKPALELYLQFMYRKIENSALFGPSTIRVAYIPSGYHPCITSVNAMRKILIRESTIGFPNRECYFVLRLIAPPSTVDWVRLLVEDEDHDVVLLHLHNHEWEIAWDGRLAEGSVVLVKEPYVRKLSEGKYVIQVDHLNSLQILFDDSSLTPSAWRRTNTGELLAWTRARTDNVSFKDWNRRGHMLCQKGGFYAAAHCYSEALRSCPEGTIAFVIRFNRAQALLRDRWYEAALYDFKIASADPLLFERALLNRCNLLHYLQRFPESIAVYSDCIAKGSVTQQIVQLGHYLKKRVAEIDSGKYEFKQLHEEALRWRPPLLNRATHLGPIIAKPSPIHGRGLFTTRAVKVGDLLLCEKAFVYASENPLKPLTLSVNADTRRMVVGTQAELLEKVVQRIFKNPSYINLVANLCHGEHPLVNVGEVDRVPIVDTCMVAHAIEQNSFGCPLTTRTAFLRSMKNENTPLDLTNQQYHSCGLWPNASFINHSCDSNARRSFIGDMLIVRATRDIAPDTEITFWYKSPLMNADPWQRTRLLQGGVFCQCAICRDIEETAPGERERREKLQVLLAKALSLPLHPARTRVEIILSAIADTYHQPASEVPRITLWELYYHAGIRFAMFSEQDKTIELVLMALESLGYIIEGGSLPHVPGTPLSVTKWGLMVDSLIGCWMCLALAYQNLAPELAVQAEGYARITYKACLGEDETFGETYGRNSARRDGFLKDAK